MVINEYMHHGVVFIFLRMDFYFFTGVGVFLLKKSKWDEMHYVQGQRIGQVVDPLSY